LTVAATAPKLLAIETATDACSVVLGRGETIAALRHREEPRLHSRMLTVFIQEAMQEAGWTFEELDAVVVSSGPGSYTGLRIGVSTAKGLGFALDKPLIGVPALEGLARHMRMRLGDWGIAAKPPFFFLPLIDARRMEVYARLFDAGLAPQSETQALILQAPSPPFEEMGQATTFVAGDGASKAEALFDGWPGRQQRLPETGCHARGLLPVAVQKWQAGQFEDLAAFEPFYLKDFVARNPSRKWSSIISQGDNTKKK
jgi:tRNA threonylcarbamoyladenosine biosynthesis protein TsaB